MRLHAGGARGVRLLRRRRRRARSAGDRGAGTRGQDCSVLRGSPGPRRSRCTDPEGLGPGGQRCHLPLGRSPSAPIVEAAGVPSKAGSGADAKKWAPECFLPTHQPEGTRGNLENCLKLCLFPLKKTPMHPSPCSALRSEDRVQGLEQIHPSFLLTHPLSA